jgi:hypothetical protein
MSDLSVLPPSTSGTTLAETLLKVPAAARALSSATKYQRMRRR